MATADSGAKFCHLKNIEQFAKYASFVIQVSNDYKRNLQFFFCFFPEISILSALNEVLKERRSLEHRRNSLLQSAVLRQHQVQETQNEVPIRSPRNNLDCKISPENIDWLQCEAKWQEKINEAQEIGEKFEKDCAAMRERRDELHKELIITIDRTTSNRFMHNIPSIRVRVDTKGFFNFVFSWMRLII